MVQKIWVTIYDAWLLFLAGLFTAFGLYIGIMYIAWGAVLFGIIIMILINTVLYAIVRKIIYKKIKRFK